MHCRRVDVQDATTNCIVAGDIFRMLRNMCSITRNMFFITMADVYYAREH
ncbi:hypothetical protein FLA_1920 [Filimonas lacunae]|nr:hypothetical protein FLA_1920 [Filimonas lacunae]